MSTISKKLSAQQINGFVNKNKQYLVINPDNENIFYFFKKDDKTITIFKNGTMLVQGNNAKFASQKSTSNQSNNRINQDYIGCDEVGVGDYFGGLVTCAVYLNKKSHAEVKQLNIKDSKELSDTWMINVFPKLTKIVKYHVSQYSPEQYNEVIKLYKNTHIAKALLHDMTIKEITSDLSEKPVVVLDAFVDSKKYYQYLNKANIKPYIVDKFETHAENKYLAVACASIIARVFFLRQIEQLSKLIHKELPLGASNSKIIVVAKDIYKSGGMDSLNKVAKIDFRITNKVVQ